MSQTVVLCGFMGCGKSTVGRELARLTGRQFVDMDAFIEKTVGQSVSEIFRERGEAWFRDREHEAACTLARQKNAVIAAGGGAMIFPRNAAVFRGAGCRIVLIDVTAEQVLDRLKNDTTRPLLLREDRAQAVQAMLQERLPLYRAAADLIVPGDGSPQQIACEIQRQIRISDPSIYPNAKERMNS